MVRIRGIYPRIRQLIAFPTCARKEKYCIVGQLSSWAKRRISGSPSHLLGDREMQMLRFAQNEWETFRSAPTGLEIVLEAFPGLRCACPWLFQKGAPRICRGGSRRLTFTGVVPDSCFYLLGQKWLKVQSVSAVPTGLRINFGFAYPALKRGAHNHCAAGAGSQAGATAPLLGLRATRPL